MSEELIKYFTQLMNMVEGVNAIVVTDREGVAILQVKNSKISDSQLRPQNLATAPVTMEQASKIGLGQTKTLIAISENSQMISFNKMPLTVTIMADKSANTGRILALEPEFTPIVQQFKSIID